jgi:hypothetical protein
MSLFLRLLIVILVTETSVCWGQLQDFGQDNFILRVQTDSQENVTNREPAPPENPPASMGTTNVLSSSSEAQEKISETQPAAQSATPVQNPVRSLGIQTFVRYNFMETNSHIGGGLTTSNGTEAGLYYQTNFGLNCIGTFGYAALETDRPNGNELDANNYDGELSLEQQVQPWPPRKSPAEKSRYPNSTLYVGTDLRYTSADRNLYGLGYQAGHQDIYDLGLSLRDQVAISNRFSLGVLAQYAYDSTNQRPNASGSSGIFSLMVAPAYSIPLESSSSSDQGGQNKSVLYLTPSLAWKRDINNEPLPAAMGPTPPPLFSNWLSVGLAVGYQTQNHFKFTAKYYYEAFNQSYDSQRVTLECNYGF